jgi:hypothetical protein
LVVQGHNKTINRVDHKVTTIGLWDKGFGDFIGRVYGRMWGNQRMKNSEVKAEALYE